MPLERRPEREPQTNDELLAMAELFVDRARRNYGTREDGNEYAQTAALISLAGSVTVIARMLAKQTRPMNEVILPDATLLDPPAGLEGE